MELVSYNGLWWPIEDRWAHEIIPQELPEALSWLKANTDRWNTAIQAGGNVGVYPQALSSLYKSVVTFEPDFDNFRALMQNVTAENVFRFMAALGDKVGSCGMFRDAANCGAHQVEEVPGSIRVMTIDGRNLSDVDLIWLDVEGSELQALQGGVETIKRHKPLIIVELKGHGKAYGYEDQAVHEFLGGLGYKLKSRHQNDWMFA